MSYQPKTHKGTYFQLPLCLLTFGATPQERLNTIIWFCTVRVGLAVWDRYSPVERSIKTGAFLQRNILRPEKSTDPLFLAAAEGTQLLGLTVPNLPDLVNQYIEILDFVTAWEKRHGRDPHVRLRKDLVFEARDNKGITPRLLWTFAAALSVIGDKKRPVRISHQTIKLRSQGYRSVAVRDAEILTRVRSAKLPTDWQIRADLDELVRRKLLSRSTYARRQSFYSSRMKAKQLIQAVYDLKVARASKRSEQLINDLSLTQNIQNSIALSKGMPLPHPNALPMNTPAPPIASEDVF